MALAYAIVRPSNARFWQVDVAVTPTVDIDGEHVTVHGVRDFRYRKRERLRRPLCCVSGASSTLAHKRRATRRTSPAASAEPPPPE